MVETGQWEAPLQHFPPCTNESVMDDRVTLLWTTVAAFITTLIGAAINYAVEARWIAPVAMFAAMVAMASYGRIRRKVRDMRKRD